MKLYELLILRVLFSLYCLCGTVWASELKSDEELIFFPALAWRENPAADWSLHVHGWIFEPEWGGGIKAALREYLGLGKDDAEDESLLHQRSAWFFVDTAEKHLPTAFPSGSRYV